MTLSHFTQIYADNANWKEIYEVILKRLQTEAEKLPVLIILPYSAENGKTGNCFFLSFVSILANTAVKKNVQN